MLWKATALAAPDPLPSARLGANPGLREFRQPAYRGQPINDDQFLFKPPAHATYR